MLDLRCHFIRVVELVCPLTLDFAWLSGLNRLLWLYQKEKIRIMPNALKQTINRKLTLARAPPTPALPSPTSPVSATAKCTQTDAIFNNWGWISALASPSSSFQVEITCWIILVVNHYVEQINLLSCFVCRRTNMTFPQKTWNFVWSDVNCNQSSLYIAQ